MPATAPDGRDRFQMREVERRLTADLHTAQEQERILSARLREVSLLPDGAPSPDLERRFAEVRASHLEAKKAHETTMRRFVDFVTKGIVPEDLRDLV